MFDSFALVGCVQVKLSVDKQHNSCRVCCQTSASLLSCP